jgi:hypothetical protein
MVVIHRGGSLRAGFGRRGVAGSRGKTGGRKMDRSASAAARTAPIPIPHSPMMGWRVMGKGNGEWETRNPSSEIQRRDLELGHPARALGQVTGNDRCACAGSSTNWVLSSWHCNACPVLRRPAAGSSIAAGLIAELAGFVSDVTSVQTAMISPNHSSGNRLTTRNGKTPGASMGILPRSADFMSVRAVTGGFDSVCAGPGIGTTR